MPRIRTIKPEFWGSPGITEMEPLARLLFIAMWNWADDFGRGTCEIRELFGFAFPREEMSVAEFRRLVGGLRLHVGVVFYIVGGRYFFEIPSWEKHQKLDRRIKASKMPSWDQGRLWIPEENTVLPADTTLSEYYAYLSGDSPDMSAGSAGFRSLEQGTGNREQGKEGGLDNSNHKGEPMEQVGPFPSNSDPAVSDPADADRPAPDSTPHDWCSPDDPRCWTHRNHPADGPCHQCGEVRKWFARDAEHEKNTRRAAIDECPHCDERGMVNIPIIGGGAKAARCAHAGPPAPANPPDKHSPQASKKTRQKALQALKRKTHEPPF